jgi:redox-sensitive bicupin YhaK (pirin superfamily)
MIFATAHYTDFKSFTFQILHLVKGSLEINGEFLNASDGAAISRESLLQIKALEDETEFLLFDLN